MIGDTVASLHTLSRDAALRFDTFHALLSEWNARMDLTAVIAPEKALYTHYLDSLTAMPYLPVHVRVIDMGTGAGFPGVPLLLARPDLQMTLLDALAKRTDFLTYAAKVVPFDAEIVHARVENFARDHRETYDAVVSRAVASLPVLLEWAMPLVRVGGQCIFWKGPGVREELLDAARIAPLLGGGNVRVVEANVPGQAGEHVLVLADKIEETDVRFPRKAGMAVKRPLHGKRMDCG